MVGATEQGVVATYGSMRLALRSDRGLPDSAPFLVAASAAGSETGGSPTSTPAAGTIAVPARLGGGWLFVVGRELWHAPSWLEHPTRLFEFNAAPRVYLGIDSLVAQEAGRAAFAFDVTGKTVKLAHWPESPAIADLAARDAKHAAVVADLRGLSITEDGGRTWREIASARTPIGVRVASGGYVVRGRNGGDERETSWRIDVHGDVRSELAGTPDGEKDARSQWVLPTGAWERVIAQGYEDAARDRFVVLDHGLLEIYRKSDGALVEHAAAGDSRAACRPIHWPSAKPGSDPGFACLGPEGTTLWRVGETHAVRVAQYPGQRRVWSSEVGTLALEGACEGAPTTAGTTTLCVWGRNGNVPVTVRLQGSSPDDVTLPLRDGSVVVLRPPSGPATPAAPRRCLSTSRRRRTARIRANGEFTAFLCVRAPSPPTSRRCSPRATGSATSRRSTKVTSCSGSSTRAACSGCASTRMAASTSARAAPSPPCIALQACTRFRGHPAVPASSPSTAACTTRRSACPRPTARRRP